ncbi:MAG TPA: hypothetical protein DHK64_15045, partial [Rhodobiaceae bacterium]|nr:hypothetical protein [Rhodobiaceae bacterium]
MRLAIALLPLCLAAEIAQYVNAVHHHDLRETALVARGEAVLGRQSTVLQELRILLETISALPLGTPANGQICDDAFKRIILQNSSISSLHLIGLEGKTLCSAPIPLSSQEERAATPRWLDESMEAQQFSIWTQKSELPVAKESDAAKARLIATLPIYDADRQAIGVLAA